MCRALGQRAIVQREDLKTRDVARTSRSYARYDTLPEPVKALIDEGTYRSYEKGENGPGVRVTLVGIHKLIPAVVQDPPLKKITWVGTANMLVEPASASTFRKSLEEQGFRDEWLAGHKARWGLRKTVAGVGVHVKQKRDGRTEIHLDLVPPKWYALFGLWHWIQDELRRKKTVTPATVAKALGLEKEL